jgi:hypothetical protein
MPSSRGGGGGKKIWCDNSSFIKIGLAWIVLRMMFQTKVVDKIDGLSGLVVSMLASGTQGHGFKPGRSRCIFTSPSSGGEVKESVPCPSFAVCKKP